MGNGFEAQSRRAPQARTFPHRTDQPMEPAGGDMCRADDAETAGTNHIEHVSSALGWPTELQPQPTNPSTVNVDLRGADIKTVW